ncbi:DUF554 domain-containing protein [uncultured Ligilactobacillus sp.]|uniref:DUF554 domain-containing protein n=1 Tax=uncultured Ligilactobacillus sp. TaxID=2837633 RepID=UPI00272A8661|nr:DUF554 domain-containing protein [uncultured Ligilactobacillus sp.]
MWGTLFNTSMIFLGSALGAFFKEKLKPAYHHTLMQALGICVILLGLNSASTNLQKSTYPVLFIISLTLGSVIGQLLHLEDKFNDLVKRFGSAKTSNGLTTGILLFCIGSLSILGPFEAALDHDYTYLITNGLLDGITSVILASAYGFSIALCGAVLFFWQGSLYLLALSLHNVLSTSLMTEISIVGGLLIFASGLNILKLTKISIVDLLPSLLIPPIFFLFWH